jgi:predicted metal-dependent hydrolase
VSPRRSAPVPIEPARLPPAVPFPVKLVRSAARRKTVGAAMEGGSLVVTVPSWMDEEERVRWAGTMAERFARRHRSEGIDIAGRAATLARRHGLPSPTAVRWATMASRWGSCTPASGEIRVSDRLGSFPPWVLDYVLVHELAHLLVADHSPEFWQRVDRYPLAERAKGYLIAKSGDDDSVDE